MPSLRALETLVAVAETGSLTSAAASLRLSQPALSHQLRSLEREVGAPIVDRLPRGVQLTAVGRAMLEAARAGTDAATRAVALGRAAATGQGGVLRVACAESMTIGLLAPAFAAWRREHPAVSIELQEHPSADVLQQDLLQGATDLSIGPRPSKVDVRLRLLGAEELFAVCSPEHPFARRSTVGVADVAAQPFIHLSAVNGLASWVDAVAAAAGAVLVPSVRVRTAVSAAALAGAGLGVTMVPRSACGPAFAGAAIPLDPPVVRDIVAMHRDPVQPVVNAFCAIVRRTAALSAAAD